MLWEEMEKYTKLTGEDATHVPIMKLGAYLDGYEKGIELIDKIRAEIEQMDFDFGGFYDHTNTIREMVLEVIDKFKAESEEV